jgi:hypothetical protein
LNTTRLKRKINEERFVEIVELKVRESYKQKPYQRSTYNHPYGRANLSLGFRLLNLESVAELNLSRNLPSIMQYIQRDPFKEAVHVCEYTMASSHLHFWNLLQLIILCLQKKQDKEAFNIPAFQFPTEQEEGRLLLDIFYPDFKSPCKQKE